MDQYAAYVFSAYGIATLVIVGLILVTWQRYRSAKKTLEQLDKRSENHHEA